jgi:hypothetical protein
MEILKKKTMVIGLALFVGIAGLVSYAIAQVPRPNVVLGGNKWLITAYDNCSPVHPQWATQCICFLPYAVNGTCIQGVWYSCSYPGWSGHYSQEGDRVRMYGNWGNYAGSDGMVIDLFAGTTSGLFAGTPPIDEGAGTWTEWFNAGTNGTTVGFLNCRLRRVGACALPNNTSRMSQADLEKLVIELSSKVRPRLRKDGKPALSPTDPEQVPLPEEK